MGMTNQTVDSLYHYVHRRSHFTTVSLSQNVKLIASGQFSHTGMVTLLVTASFPCRQLGNEDGSKSASTSVLSSRLCSGLSARKLTPYMVSARVVNTLTDPRAPLPFCCNNNDN